MKRLLKSVKGFTLVELMVVIIIIGVLASISVPIYRQYLSRARASEGQALVGAVAAAERVFFAEHNTYTADPNDLNVDAGRNTFFTSYTIPAADATGFTVQTTGIGEAAGITVTLVQGAAGGPTITVAGL